jgi:hypothetical protein
MPRSISTTHSSHPHPAACSAAAVVAVWRWSHVPARHDKRGHNQLTRSLSIWRRRGDLRMAPTVDTRSIRRRRHSRSRSIQPSTPTIPSQISPHSSQTQASAYLPAQPRRSHTQIDTRSAHHSPRRQPLGPVSPLPSPGLPSDSQAYRTTSDPYAPPSHPPSFQKPPATALVLWLPHCVLRPHTRLVYLVISIRPPLALPPPWLPAPDSLYPAHQQLPRAAIQQSQQPPGPSTSHGYGPPVQQQQQYYLPSDQAMAVEPPSPAPKRKTCGFKRVRDANDLRPLYVPPPSGTGQPNPNVSVHKSRAASPNTC